MRHTVAAGSRSQRKKKTSELGTHQCWPSNKLLEIRYQCGPPFIFVLRVFFVPSVDKYLMIARSLARLASK